MSKEQNKTVVFTATIGEEEKELLVSLPNLEQQREGQKHYNTAFSEAVSSKALLRTKLDDFMEEQGLWSKEKEKQVNDLGRDINEKEQLLAKGGIKLSQAKEAALDLKRLRGKLRRLVSKRMDLDVHTAEGQAENARFNYWVSACVVYNNTKKPVFSSLDDYLKESNESYASDAAAKLANLLYGINENLEDDLEETKFLREFGFINEDGRLVDKEGNLVDAEGNLVDEEGYLINEDGQRVDVDGNPLDEDGNYTFERQPFLDDDDNPIELEVQTEEEKPVAVASESEAEEE